MIRLTEAQIHECCACRSFAAKLSARLASDAAASGSVEGLITAARDIWWHQTSVAGWLEAFGAHPRIGDAAALRAQHGGFADMSRHEQSAAAGASDAVHQELAEWNAKYEAKFGHVFLIFAAGKSAHYMLAALKARFDRAPHEELRQAAAEQMRITEKRLRSVLGAQEQQSHVPASAGARSPVTSHVLDTALGRPAAHVQITLQRAADGSTAAGDASAAAGISPEEAGSGQEAAAALSDATVWDTLGSGRTNADGRVPELLPPSDHLPAGRYRVVFAMSEYMAGCRAEHPGIWPEHPFYPVVTVVFQVSPRQEQQHFHIPLTWNPFGYSTYRGS